jgi:hypothetical protein
MSSEENLMSHNISFDLGFGILESTESLAGGSGFDRFCFGGLLSEPEQSACHPEFGR